MACMAGIPLDHAHVNDVVRLCKVRGVGGALTTLGSGAPRCHPHDRLCQNASLCAARRTAIRSRWWCVCMCGCVGVGVGTCVLKPPLRVRCPPPPGARQGGQRVRAARARGAQSREGLAVHGVWGGRVQAPRGHVTAPCAVMARRSTVSVAAAELSVPCSFVRFLRSQAQAQRAGRRAQELGDRDVRADRGRGARRVRRHPRTKPCLLHKTPSTRGGGRGARSLSC